VSARILSRFCPGALYKFPGGDVHALVNLTGAIRFAKPSYVGSNPMRASEKLNPYHRLAVRWSEVWYYG
jgi:hypothetical protein